MRYNAAAPDADETALCNALSGDIIADFNWKFQTKNLKNFLGKRKTAFYDAAKFGKGGCFVGAFPYRPAIDRYAMMVLKRTQLAQPALLGVDFVIILIGGASHTGKTLLAQHLLEKYRYPYLSIDHLKMGLIRSGQTALTPMDDDKLTDYLWPIVREVVKTAIENGQNLIVEGCYIPFDWKKDFEEGYRKEIRYVCLIMSRRYIETHFADIKNHAKDIEKRMDDSGLDPQELIRENTRNLELCKQYGCDYFLMDEKYHIPL